MSENINSAIDKAATLKGEEHYESVFRILANSDLVINFRDNKYQQCQMVTLAENINAFVVYTSSNDSRIGDFHGIIKWEEALSMLLKVDQVETLLVQSGEAAWIAISKERARKILEAKKSH